MSTSNIASATELNAGSPGETTGVDRGTAERQHPKGDNLVPRSHTVKESYPPSYFAQRGQPMCSKWGKSEIEWIAHAYVKALAKDGDTWKRLSREEVRKLLSDEELGYVETMLRLDNERYKDWFDAVADQITDSEGAFGVRGFWNKPYPRPDDHELKTNHGDTP